tara:strand:+ start:3596 stop:3934 length:339 start_codon:yes stop_codon:yes gene_type:complete
MDDHQSHVSELSVIDIHAYIYKVRMLWQGRTDKVSREEYPFLVWLSNSFTSAPKLDVNKVNFRHSAFDKSLHEQYANELEINLFNRYKKENSPKVKKSVLSRLFKALRKGSR